MHRIDYNKCHQSSKHSSRKRIPRELRENSSIILWNFLGIPQSLSQEFLEWLPDSLRMGIP